MTHESNGAPAPGAVANYRVELGGRAVSVELAERDDGLFARIDGGPARRVDLSMAQDVGELSVMFGGTIMRGLVAPSPDAVTVVVDGYTVDAVVLDERAVRLASAAAGGRSRTTEAAIRAPMPGLVVGVLVEVGQQVAKGETLVILSAMKMQNELTSPVDATVKEVLVANGQTVDQNAVLIRLE